LISGVQELLGFLVSEAVNQVPQMVFGGKHRRFS